MQDISLAGIIIAVIAVLAAYVMGYINGIARGRDKGYNDGKRDGSREGSVHAFAEGFDRGKRARDDDDDDDDEEPDHGERGNGQLSLVILAAAAGFLTILWLSSQSSETQTPPLPPYHQAPSATLPRVAPLDSWDRTQPSPETESRPETSPAYLPPTETVTLPRVHRTLPTTSPVPVAADGPQQPYGSPTEIERGSIDFPHPPPAFGQP